MIIKDFLDCISVENIVDILIVDDKEKEENREAVIIGYTKLIEKLKEKQPKESDYIALGIKKLDEFDSDSEIKVSTIIAKKQEVKAYDYEQLNEFINCDINNITEESAAHYIELLNEFPDTYSSDFMDWERVVGIEVDIFNIKEYGLENLFADILYDMTFFGFSEDEKNSEEEKLRKSLEESKAIIDEKRKETEKRLHTVEEIFNELGFVDNRTEEEKIEAERQIRTRVFQNYIYKYNALKKYKDDSSNMG